MRLWPLSFLLFACGGAPLPVGPERSCETVLRFAPEMSASDATVLGEWNGFKAQAMSRRSDGSFEYRITLAPRDYAYRFSAGSPVLDPLARASRWVNETEHSRLRVEDCSKPTQEVSSFAATPAGALTFEVEALRGNKGPSLTPPKATVDGAVVSASWSAATGRLNVQLNALSKGKHAARVELDGAAPLYLPFWIEDEPFEWNDALLYFTFTDRFRDGDPSNNVPVAEAPIAANYAGGDWAGITEKINDGYFDKLGVRALWLSPLDSNPATAFAGAFDKKYSGYHGYWPSAARTPEEHFGSLSELQALTRAAHAKGIRVIADLVLNHVHQEHPYFRDHKNDGWFNITNACVCAECGFDNRPLDCWFTNYLPDVSWRNGDLADQLTADALWWLEQGDLDGFRVDAVKHFDLTGTRAISGAVSQIEERTGIDLYLVGETFTGSDGRDQIRKFIGPGLLDGQFDFPLYWPVIDTFTKGGSFAVLDKAVRDNEAFYAPGTINSPFLGNHDVARFISAAAGQLDADVAAQAWSAIRPADLVTDDAAFSKARAAFTFLLGQRGVPLIYYGDEIGLPGAGDPDNRRVMKFGAGLSARESSLLATVQSLGQARSASRALTRGTRRTVTADAQSYVFVREEGTDAAIVVLHRGGARSVTFDVPGPDRNFRSVTDGKTVRLGGPTSRLDLSAEFAGIFVPAE